ncbi:DUF3817 domain-containing protein [Thermocrispum municipale]|jgi:integral membrane protein|uniref:DUF3817 domain-containing protein n=1 Tax=Thermocrispum municipale TaxID=37926 RepID=UPI00041802FC|nr:DUF3817 domain-containing protein [Thermocrispum municipale]
MTSSQTPASADTTAEESVKPNVLAALKRFRVAAIATGIGLLILVTVMVIRYGWDNPTPSQVWSPMHGALYMIYIALAVDLAIKARWSIKGILLVLLAGCVPFVSFIAERKVTHRVLAGRSI